MFNPHKEDWFIPTNHVLIQSVPSAGRTIKEKQACYGVRLYKDMGEPWLCLQLRGPNNFAHVELKRPEVEELIQALSAEIRYLRKK